MNSRYVQIEVCYKHRNSHISGMLTLVCFFVHVQMETQICGNSWYYPPPLTHALLPAPRSDMLTLTCQVRVCGRAH